MPNVSVARRKGTFKGTVLRFKLLLLAEIRAATAGKAGKDWSFPRFGDTLTLSQPGGGGQIRPTL